jgi:hypothetical protein
MNGQQECKLWYLMLYTEQPPFNHKNTTDSKFLWFRKQEDRNDKFFTHWTRDQDQHIIEPQRVKKKRDLVPTQFYRYPFLKFLYFLDLIVHN